MDLKKARAISAAAVRIALYLDGKTIFLARSDLAGIRSISLAQLQTANDHAEMHRIKTRGNHPICHDSALQHIHTFATHQQPK